MAGAEYEIAVRGRLSNTVEAALEGVEVVSFDPQETRLRGWITDQAALHGILGRVRDLGLELTAVRRLEVNTGAGPRGRL
jgi:hypothetical protein